MNPIPQVNIGGAGPAIYRQSPSNIAELKPTGQNPLAGLSSSATNNLSSLSALHSAVTALLENLGGDLQNDKALQMMIALIIILAMLNNSQGQSTSNGSLLSELGTAGNGQPMSLSAYSSSTTISIQQTTTTLFYYSSESYTAATSGDTGSEIDVSA